jgi:SAM-dependent methyltransferase
VADYDALAMFYDHIHGSRRKTVRYLKKLLKTTPPGARKLLSLACGTGRLEQAFSKRYEITGIDISKSMVAEAKARCPRGTFYCQDMCDIDFEAEFDVVLCAFASINHLLQFEDWDAFFERVARALKPGGLFVFDMLSEVCLHNLLLNSPLLQKTSRLFSVTEFTRLDDNITKWHVKAFSIKSQPVPLFTVNVKQTAFDATRITKALSKHFAHIDTFDPEQGHVTSRSELLYFACTKA